MKEDIGSSFVRQYETRAAARKQQAAVTRHVVADVDEDDVADDLTVADEDDEGWYPRMPRSALRLRDTREEPNETTTGLSRQQTQAMMVTKRHAVPARGSALRSKVEVTPGPPPQRASGTKRETEPLPRRWRLHPLVFIGLALFIAILGWVVFTDVATWMTNIQNHWQYGYPRTAQYDEVVGHHDSAAHPSHFIALNYEGQVEVIEFPGGDVSHARIYTGVVVVGQNANLVPVTLAFRDVNGDGKLDMIVAAGNAQYVFLNEKGQFVKANQQP